MIKIEVCSNCKIKKCDLHMGIDIFEELRYYRELFIEREIDFSLTECSCLGKCKGPVVKVNGRIYSEVDEDKVEKILNGLLE